VGDFEFKLNGIEQVVARMRALPVELRGKAGMSALGKAAKVVREAAKENALRVDDPDTGRRIADNVIQRFRSRYYRKTGDLMISVGVGTERGRIPKGNPDTGPRGNTPHWHLVELGTERARAEPFLRPALESNIGAARDTFARELDKAIDRILKKRR
jgi:HK97 gp10 family phage protein